MPPDNIALDQLTETSLLEFPKGHFRIRCAYSRSTDCQQADHEGQDYLVFRANSKKLVFALCDGVGGSFFGDIAAKRVGDRLISWLWAIAVSDTHESSYDFAEKLEAFLNGIAPQVQNEVDLLDIGWVDPPALIPVLEKKKSNGTQTTFVCGVYCAPTKIFPKGKALFFWLGNSRLHLWRRGFEQSGILKAQWSDRNRWYSNKGVEGKIQSFVGDLDSVDSFVAHSDGFDRAIVDVVNEPRLIDDFRPGIDKSKLDETINRLQTLPKNDDISYFEVEYKDSLNVQQTYLTDENEINNSKTVIVDKPGPVVYLQRSVRELLLNNWRKVLLSIFITFSIIVLLLMTSYFKGVSTATQRVKATANAQLIEELTYQATRIANVEKPLPTQIQTEIPVPLQVPAVTSIPYDIYPKLAPMLLKLNPGESWQSLCYEKLHFFENNDYGACSDPFVQGEIIKYIASASNETTAYENFRSSCETMTDPSACSLSSLNENQLYGFFPPTPNILLSGNYKIINDGSAYLLVSNNNEEFINITFDGIGIEEIASVIEGHNSGKYSLVLLFGSFIPDENVLFYPEAEYFRAKNLPVVISYMEVVDNQNNIEIVGRLNMSQDQGSWIYTLIDYLPRRDTPNREVTKDISSFSPDRRILVYTKILTSQDGLLAGLNVIDYWFYDWGEGGYRQYFP